MKNTNAPAAELAANFQVSELEPRLENTWGIISIPGPEYPPMCGDGQMPDSNGQC